jgi:hypothetical protein
MTDRDPSRPPRIIVTDTAARGMRDEWLAVLRELVRDLEEWTPRGRARVEDAIRHAVRTAESEQTTHQGLRAVRAGREHGRCRIVLDPTGTTVVAVHPGSDAQRRR